MLSESALVKLVNCNSGLATSSLTYKTTLITTIKRRLSDVGIYLVESNEVKSFKVCVKKLNATALVHNELAFLKQEYINHQAVYFELNCSLHLPRVYGLDENEKVLVSEYLPHNTTFEKWFTSIPNWLLNKRFSKLEAANIKIAEILRIFHAADCSNIKGVTSAKIENMKEYLLLRIKLILEYLTARHFPSKTITQFSDLENLVHSLDESLINSNNNKLIHGDFTPANLLQMADGEIGVIDFADVRFSCVEQDIACFQNYILMLSLNKFWFGAKKTERLIKSFEDAYFESSNLSHSKLATFRFRMLLTNTLTLVYECQSNKLKAILFRRKLKRYVSKLIEYNQILGTDNEFN